MIGMNEFKMIDDREEPNEDSYETDPKLFRRLEKQYKLNFKLDAFARDYNKLCDKFLSDALHDEWIPGDVWCNGPHSINEECIRRADAQHRKHNINICMIIPTNVQSSKVWHQLIENETTIFVENHPLLGRPNFRKRGRKTLFPSRNAYRVIIWRKI